MADQITELVADLRRLVLEIERSQQDKKKGNGQEKEKKEVRLEGQILAREPDMILVSKLKNAGVYAPDETKIGDVSDLIIKPDGKVEGVIVGVNGGEKNVALKTERFKLTPEPDGRARIVIGVQKEELQQAPSFTFKPRQEQKSTS
jgi:hypothetical protein